MHILHGTWQPQIGRFALWGEDASQTPKCDKRTDYAPHPFMLDTSTLLRHAIRTYHDTIATGHTLPIWLPGGEKGPHPSPEAIAAGMPPPNTSPERLELLSWRVATIGLEPPVALRFLLNLPRDDRGGFTVGRDLAYWRAAATLALNCLIEGRYLPALSEQGRNLVARWQPQPDPALVDALAGAMPPLCRAMVEYLTGVPGARELLDAFLAACVDGFIRAGAASKAGSKYPPRHPWLRALTGEDALVAGSSRERAALWEAYRAWREPFAEIRASGGFRVCFRLQEPDVDGAPWALMYVLQAEDDPSLMIDAAAAWSAPGGTLTYLNRRFDRPQEKLLIALGAASRLFPPIERSLQSAAPAGVALTAEEAYRFLAEVGPLLESAGFGVLVPNWWGRRARLKAKARVTADGDSPTGLLNRDSLIRFQWEVAVGEQGISRAEFEQLVALKQPLVRFRGEWVALDPAQIESALRFFEAHTADGEGGLLDALRLTAEAPPTDGLNLIEIERAEAEGRLAALLAQLNDPDRRREFALPARLNAVLRPYQERGVGWLAHMRQLGLGALLADHMGLGKTLQTIALWLHERDSGIQRPALVVAPTSVVGNWRHEIARFAPSLRIYVHHGPARLTGKKFERAAADSDVVLTSYALLHRDLETLKRVQWADVVLDEAQNIKNPSTKAAQAARALPADHRVALTGTPIENRLTELWSIFQFLNPGYLGSREQFRDRFALPIERYGDDQAAETLRRLTRPFILRRLKTDPNVISDLPDKIENKVYCALTAEQATLYEAVVREELEAIEEAEDEMGRRGSILRMLTRLKQVCNHPAHFLKESLAGTEGETLRARLDGRSGKLARLTEMLEEVREADEAALIFTQYAEMGTLLQAYLADCFGDEVLYLHGGTPARKREEMIERFQTPRGPALFVLSLKAGGTGLNLTRANHVFHYDRWFNPAVEDQATDRAFRIGQTKNVTVHKYLCLGTLEERIDELITRKQGLAERIVGKGENWLSEMTNEELRDLVTLRREVMAQDE